MKYPKIPKLQELKNKQREILFKDAYIFEKLDGGNSQIDIKPDKISHGLRAGRIDKNTKKRVSWAKNFDRFFWSNYSSFEKLKADIYFGEFLAPHRIKYKKDYVNNFFLIDVHDRDHFIPYEEARKRVIKLEGIIRTVEILYRGKVTDSIIDKLLYGKSSYAEDGIREGLVLKSYDKQIFAKVLHPKYDNKR